jgi:hypothetical protein
MTTSEDSSAIPADEVVRSFLLGRLDATARTKFEEQLMTDDRLHERVRRAEFQLADDFVKEQIDRIDRQRFVKTFMVTSDRGRMVAVSDALRQRFSQEIDARAKPRALRTSWRRLFIFRQPAWRFAFGVLVLLLLIGSWWLVTKEPQIVRKFIPKRITGRPAATETPQEANHPSNAAPPDHRESTSSPPEHESSPSNTAAESTVVTTVALSPGTQSDMGQAPTVTLPDGVTGLVRFELTVQRNEPGEFQAELFTANQSVFVANSVKANGNSAQLDFEVPVRVLKTGDYEIKLSRLHDGSKQVVANYYFRVR